MARLTTMASWLLSALRAARASDLPAGELPYAPEMFVFRLSSSAGGLASSGVF